MAKPKFGDLVISAIMVLSMLALSYIMTGSLPAGFRFLQPDTSRSPRSIAIVSIDTKEIMRIPLDGTTDGLKYEIGEHGKLYSILAVENSRISFALSNCPDKVCVNTGWISMTGQSAVCLPNRVMVRIVNQANATDDVDITLK